MVAGVYTCQDQAGGGSSGCQGSVSAFRDEYHFYTNYHQVVKALKLIL